MKGYSGGSFSVFLDEEAAILEREGVEVALHDGRENLFLLRVVLVASVHETIFLARVAVEITIQHKVPFLLHPLYHLLRMVDSRVQLLAGVDPLPIQVDHAEVAPVVSDDDAVRV
jgi:hypothetical protein